MNKRRLDSWKGIAAFLGRSLRTVQRWHELNGLPVHHFGSRQGSVFAYEEEIDQWLSSFAAEHGNAPSRAEETLHAGRKSSSELVAAAGLMWETRSERNIHAIAEMYRKAIADDSGNSAAYAGLAIAMVFCTLNDLMDGSMAYLSAVEALRRMPSEDPAAKCPAAWIDLLYKRNWPQARAGFEEILSQRPTSSALVGMAAMHIAEGNTLKAQEYAWKGWRLSPLVSSLGAFLCWTVYLNGDFQQVLDLVAQIRSGGGDGSFISAVEALALIQSREVSGNLAHLEKASLEFPQNQTLQGILGYAYGISDNRAKARNLYAHLAHGSEANRKSNGYAQALVSMGFGNHQGAISWLETAYAEGTLWSLGFNSDPMLKPLAGDPRFVQLAGKIGGADQYRDEAESLAAATHSLLEGALVGDNL